MKCSKCNADIVPDGMASGYGVNVDGDIHCYLCCAVEDRKQMIAKGNMKWNPRSCTV